VPLQRLRPAVERLGEEFGRYPLAHGRPFLDVEGRELVRRVQDEVGLDRQLQIVVVRNDQIMLDLLAERFTRAVTYADDGLATTLLPSARTPAVRMDPERAFGQPSIRGVRTDVLAEEFRAGAGRESLADLYDLDFDQIDQALRFELIASSAQAG